MPNASTDTANRQDDPFTSDCPGRELFNHITGRWGLLILMALSEQPTRFHMLRNQVQGISEKILTQNLKTLARDGLIKREVEPTVPPQVSYCLTPLGLELANQFKGLTHWIARRLPDVTSAQQEYDRQR